MLWFLKKIYVIRKYNLKARPEFPEANNFQDAEKFIYVRWLTFWFGARETLLHQNNRSNPRLRHLYYLFALPEVFGFSALVGWCVRLRGNGVGKPSSESKGDGKT